MPQYRALCRRWFERERRQDIRFGVALAAHFNSQSEQGARKIKPGDLYGHYLPEAEQSDEEMLAFMRQWSAGHNRQLEKSK